MGIMNINRVLNRVLCASDLMVRHNAPNGPSPLLLCDEAALALSLRCSSAMLS